MSRRLVVLSAGLVALFSLGPGLRAPSDGVPLADRTGASATASQADRLLQAVSFSSATDGWAVGRMGESGSDQPLAQHWDGSRWRASRLPIEGQYANQLLGVDDRNPQDVWAVGWSADTPETGDPLTEHWDGTSWKVVPSPDPSGIDASYLESISVASANDAWAVGYYFDPDREHLVPLILHWNGSAWSLQAAMSPGKDDRQLFAVTAVSASDVWAVGHSNTSHGGMTPLALHFDGTAWQPVPLPVSSDRASLEGLTAVSSSDVWAVGSVTEHWDGTKWSIVSSPSTDLSSVSASASDDVWAVGGSYSRSVSQHWDGQSWTVVKTPNLPHLDRLFGVAAVSPGQASAVGYTLSRTRLRSILLSWDGSSWTRCRRVCSG